MLASALCVASVDAIWRRVLLLASCGQFFHRGDARCSCRSFLHCILVRGLGPANVGRAAVHRLFANCDGCRYSAVELERYFVPHRFGSSQGLTGGLPDFKPPAGSVAWFASRRKNEPGRRQTASSGLDGFWVPQLLTFRLLGFSLRAEPWFSSGQEPYADFREGLWTNQK